MKLIHKPDDLINGARQACLAIGMFDGVHLGHQQVLRQAIEDSHRHEARSVAVTFDRHPATGIAPVRAPALLQTRAQRLHAIESLGIDAALLIKFDKAFSRKPGAEFVQELADGFGTIHCFCVGVNFAFGHKRDGNVELLRTLGQALGFHVHGLRAVSLDGQAVQFKDRQLGIHARLGDRASAGNKSATQVINGKRASDDKQIILAARLPATEFRPSAGKRSVVQGYYIEGATEGLLALFFRPQTETVAGHIELDHASTDSLLYTSPSPRDRG